MGIHLDHQPIFSSINTQIFSWCEHDGIWWLQQFKKSLLKFNFVLSILSANSLILFFHTFLYLQISIVTCTDPYTLQSLVLFFASVLIITVLCIILQ